MSPQESRSIWCFLEGNTKPYFVFDIPIGVNVAQLKNLIRRSIDPLRNADPHELKLLKLNATVPIDPDDSLARRLGEVGDIAACSRELSSGEKVGTLFPEPLSQEHLHLVVQSPDIVLSNLSASRKRTWSATDEDGRPAKRKEIGRDVLDIQTRCAAIHNAIKEMPHKNLSDPSTFVDLPCPSLISLPQQRFALKEIDNIALFKYMGRSNFRELLQRMENESFLKRFETLYLYGTSGSGKSHLLAALVYHLIREGKRVFYIPDCYTLLQDPFKAMRDAWHFAYYNSPVLETIGCPDDVKAFISFLGNDREVYIIIDQVNALEYTDNDFRKDKKVEASNWLDTLRLQHRYVFSSSANEYANRDAYKKQYGISVIRTFGGMSPDETDQWFIQHRDQIPQLSPEQRQHIEYLTGCIPLLLRWLINLPKFDEHAFRNIRDLFTVVSDVGEFATLKLASLDPLTKEIYLKIMRACVGGHWVPSNNQSLFDSRHFYVDAEGIGRFTCGFAFEAMMSILRTHDNGPFLDDLWYDAVERSDNPIVRGFLAEQICLSHIAAHGLQTVHSRLGPMSSASFAGKPAFGEFLSTGQTMRLYVPSAYNFATVDGAILLLDRACKKATIFAIQFTLSQRHKQSDEEFHEKLWPEWIKPIVSAEFSVESTFVWIDTKQPSEHVKPKAVKALRSGDKVVHPAYSVIHVGVETVNRRLAIALNLIH